MNCRYPCGVFKTTTHVNNKIGMKDRNIIKGKEIENLITKFYYKNKQLYFQIILNLGLGKKVFYREFSDYYKYKKSFDQLLKAKSENRNVVLSTRLLQHATN